MKKKIIKLNAMEECKNFLSASAFHTYKIDVGNVHHQIGISRAIIYFVALKQV